MMKKISLATIALAAGVAVAQQFPMLDNIANKVVQKYQSSNCEQLWVQKAQPKSAEEQRLIGLLKSDPAMRAEFINRVAGPMANKMFEEFSIEYRWSPEYYDELHSILLRMFQGADTEVVDHVIPLIAAFDTATALGLSFGISKFQPAQHKVKLVGEIVSREGRSLNPEVVRAIKNWPPINTLKDCRRSWARLTIPGLMPDQLIARFRPR